MDVHKICLISGTALNCVLIFSTSEYIFFTLHDNTAFLFLLCRSQQSLIKDFVPIYVPF